MHQEEGFKFCLEIKNNRMFKCLIIGQFILELFIIEHVSIIKQFSIFLSFINQTEQFFCVIGIIIIIIIN
jgi:hypothetical protein